MKSLHEKVNWFCNNLELQVEDIKLERAGKSLVHYFDSGDVQGALLGLQDLYYFKVNKFEFDLKEFGAERTLIRALLSSKRLGQIRMLPPHQDEFISKLKDGFTTWNRGEWRDKVRDFLDQVNLSSAHSYLQSATQNPDEIARFLMQDIKTAETLFKVFQYLLPWHRRLGVWERKGLIHYEQTRASAVIINSPAFKHLERRLDSINARRGKYINNTTDALAWSYLYHLVEDFNSGKSNVVPRFYSPETKFSLQRVLALPHDPLFGENDEKLNEELIKKLKIKSEVGELTVLRDDYYYLFKVAFRSASFAAGSAPALEANDDQLIELYNHLNRGIRGERNSESEGISDEDLRQLSYRGRPIVEIIEELQQVTFFKSEWLRRDLYADSLEALNDVREYLTEIESMTDAFQLEEYQEAVSRIINDIQGNIQDNLQVSVQAYSSIPLFLKPLNNEIKNLESRIHRDTSGVNDYYRDLGLLRYGFPDEIRREVQSILDGLCSGDEDTIQKSRIAFTDHYLDVRFYGNSDLNLLMTTTAVLLALRMHKDIFETLKDKKLEHFSLQITLAGMLLELGRKGVAQRETYWKDGRKLMEELRQQQANQSISSEECARHCIGLTYLFYQAWKFQGNDAEWRTLDAGQHAQRSSRWQDLIDQAISFSGRAYSLLTEDQLQLKVYALNQHVFCLVEGGPKSRMNQLMEAAQQLAQYKSEAHLWQFRYDDTLARVNHRLAVFAKTEQEWQVHTDEALRLSEAAMAKSDNDEEVSSLYSALTIYKSRGFSKGRQ
jgi:hypothetical protein